MRNLGSGSQHRLMPAGGDPARGTPRGDTRWRPRERGVCLGRTARARQAGGRAGAGARGAGVPAVRRPPLGLQGRPPGAVGGPPAGGLSRGSVNGAAGGTGLRLMRARWAAPRLAAAPTALISTKGLRVPRTSAPCPARSRPGHPCPSKPLSALAPGQTGARPGARQARLSVLHPATVPQNPRAAQQAGTHAPAHDAQQIGRPSPHSPGLQSPPASRDCPPAFRDPGLSCALSEMPGESWGSDGTPK